MKTCVIFCAGGFDTLAEPLDIAHCIIAADGGYTHLLSLGVTPDYVLGDFDSLGYVPKDARIYPVEKDDTDAMLAIRLGLELGCDRFLLYGSLDGKRLDHTVANFQALQYLADHGAQGWLIGQDQLVTLVQNGTLRFSPDCSGTLSLFCLGAEARDVTLTGLHYPLTRGILTPGFPLGVSNKFCGTAASVTVEQGSLLVILERKNELRGILYESHRP